jgi:hypothetical protein
MALYSGIDALCQPSCSCHKIPRTRKSQLNDLVKVSAANSRAYNIGVQGVSTAVFRVFHTSSKVYNIGPQQKFTLIPEHIVLTSNSQKQNCS